MHASKISIGAMAMAAFVLWSTWTSGVDAAEIVKFRLSQWTSAHFDDAQSATVYQETLKKIGCEAQQHRHGDHYDVRYRCPQWRSISFKSHSDAHKWEHWMKSYGFETVHQH